MGVAGPIFEPHPPNFENQYNFLRCSNDNNMIFLLVSDFKDQCGSVLSVLVAALEFAE